MTRPRTLWVAGFLLLALGACDRFSRISGTVTQEPSAHVRGETRDVEGGAVSDALVTVYFFNRGEELTLDEVRTNGQGEFWHFVASSPWTTLGVRISKTGYRTERVVLDTDTATVTTPQITARPCPDRRSCWQLEVRLVRLAD
jgi:hypothetical protein